MTMSNLYRETLLANVHAALAKWDAAGAHQHAGTKGRTREISLAELIEPLLSPSMAVCTGTVIDSSGAQSGQMDVIVLDRDVAPPMMTGREEGVVPFEAVLAAIEVKSSLDATELKASIGNARKLKSLTGRFVEVPGRYETRAFPIRTLGFHVFAGRSDLKSDSECERLERLVAEANAAAPDQPIYVPITSLCVFAARLRIFCEDADWRPPRFSFERDDGEAETVLAFLASVVDHCHVLAAQRRRLSLKAYLTSGAQP
jgi:hypothetical protein